MDLAGLFEKFTRWPDQAGLILTGLSIILLAILIIPLGFKTGFLKIKIVSKLEALSLIPRLLVFPSIFEEIIYRGILLPAIPTGFTDPKLYLTGLNLMTFVFMHPINAKLFFKRGDPTFYKPFFLFATFLLGLTCTILTWQTKSLISAIFIHWIVVFIWIVFLGGWEKLNHS